MKEVQIYSDGSCLGNPGPGGWACILKFGEHEKMISGGKPKTTNNHMELSGVIAGLSALKYPCDVEVITDSKYVTDAFNKGWVYNWEAKGNFHGRPNSELWQELMPLVRRHKVKFIWIKGHAGHHYNELCDKEAVRQSRIMSKTTLHKLDPYLAKSLNTVHEFNGRDGYEDWPNIGPFGGHGDSMY